MTHIVLRTQAEDLPDPVQAALAQLPPGATLDVTLSAAFLIEALHAAQALHMLLDPQALAVAEVPRRQMLASSARLARQFAMMVAQLQPPKPLS